MKDFEQQPEPIEILSEQQQKKEKRLIGQQRKIRGLTLWEYNEKTRQLSRAKYELINVRIDFNPRNQQATHVHKVIVNDDCQYFQALNEKNAKRKIGL